MTKGVLRRENLLELRDVYRDGLLEDTLPFWVKHCVDRECGGFHCCLDRDGSVISPEKGTWVHGRFSWLLATLYATVERRPEWLELAKHGVDFLSDHAFDADGRMFFMLDRDGTPLRKRRYLFSETFGVIAFAAYAKAAGHDESAQRALDLFKLVVRYHTTPGSLEAKGEPGARPAKPLAMPMILITTAQVLRDVTDDPVCNERIERSIGEIEQDFMRPEFEAVLETVGADGGFIDTFDGRMICPGHAIEAAWFILHEAKVRDDARLRDLGLKILDWMWEWGWDGEHGGITYYRDAKNLPCTEYWHDMKFWWPHNEAIIATLLAYHLTGDEKYAKRHRLVHDWAHARFPDPEHGEWFGYLHRDGRLSTPVKGNNWKGPFHLPRMQLYCWQLLEEMLAPPSQP